MNVTEHATSATLMKKELRIPNVPEYRISNVVTEDLKRIYEQVRDGNISSGDLAIIFRLKAPTSGGFYERRNSLIYYGLMERKIRGLYALTEWGRQIANPENEDQRITAYRNAVFNVPLWKELHSSPGGLPTRIWYSIRKFTELTADQSQMVEQKIREWYQQDVSFIESQTEEIKQPSELSKGLSSTSDNNNTEPKMMSQKQTYQDDFSGNITLHVKGRTFDMPIFDKDSLELAIGALKLLGKKLGLKIESKDDENFKKNDQTPEPSADLQQEDESA